MSAAPERGGRPAAVEPFVPVPCRLIDEVMPQLKDTELRLLLVVLRQTLGRRGPDGAPREWDWLAHSQLKARTGRGGGAVSSAVDALARRGLVVVRDGAGGMPLATPAARRRCRGRLHYGAGPALRPLLWRPAAKGPQQHPLAAGDGFRKPGTTGEADGSVCRRSRKPETVATPGGRGPEASASGEAARRRIEAEKRRIRARLARIPRR